MIPRLILSAMPGWTIERMEKRRRILWLILSSGEVSVVVKRDRFRHTRARAYRGNALTAVLPTQTSIARFLLGDAA